LNRRVDKRYTPNLAQPTVSRWEFFVYDAGRVVMELFDPDGTLLLVTRSFAYNAYIDAPLLLVDEEGGTPLGGVRKKAYYLQDRRFGVAALANESGAIVERVRYEAFGAMTVYAPQLGGWTPRAALATPKPNQSAFNNPYGYTGRRYDAETATTSGGGSQGLWYYRNRMYSSRLGRFLQRDPAGYVDGFNLYAYVRNNPLGFVDALGLGRVSTIVEPGLLNKFTQSTPFGLNSFSNDVPRLTAADLAINSNLIAGNNLTFGDRLSIAARRVDQFGGQVAGVVLGQGIIDRRDASLGRVLGASGHGLQGGVSITANTFSFGGTDFVGLTDSTRFQGAEFTASRVFSTISREGFFTAATLGTGQLIRAGATGTVQVVNIGLKVKEGADIVQGGLSGVQNLQQGNFGSAALDFGLTGLSGLSFADDVGDIGRALQRSGGLTPATPQITRVANVREGGFALNIFGRNTPNRGLTFVTENLGSPRTPAMQIARDFEAGTTGAASSLATRQRFVPALKFDNPNPNGASLVRFDGFENLDNGVVQLIDSKTRIVPFTQNGAPIITGSVRDQLFRQSAALGQNPGFRAVIELPTEAARKEADQVLIQLGLDNIATRVR